MDIKSQEEDINKLWYILFYFIFFDKGQTIYFILFIAELYLIDKERMNFNFIRYFLRPSGDLITDPFLMSFHAVTHFQKILGPMPAPAVGIISTSLWFRSLTGFFCSDSQCLQMTTFPQDSTEALGVFLVWRLSNLYATSSILRSYQHRLMPLSCH